MVILEIETLSKSTTHFEFAQIKWIYCSFEDLKLVLMLMDIYLFILLFKFLQFLLWEFWVTSGRLFLFKNSFLWKSQSNLRLSFRCVYFLIRNVHIYFVQLESPSIVQVKFGTQPLLLIWTLFIQFINKRQRTLFSFILFFILFSQLMLNLWPVVIICLLKELNGAFKVSGNCSDFQSVTKWGAIIWNLIWLHVVVLFAKHEIFLKFFFVMK